MTETVHIDGSFGEGGGQIVRSSLALSMVTGKPVVIEKIRAGRKKPGLKRQHLTGVNAAATISNAQIEGAELGASSLSFSPGTVSSGDYYFSVGTAGSATLVLQTVLPALSLAPGPSTVTVEGGTHNQWAPPFDFLAKVYLPQFSKFGPNVNLELHQHGFFPAGGGKFTATIQPVEIFQRFSLLQRGELRKRRVEALVANLPGTIGRREVTTALRLLRWSSHEGQVHEVKSSGPGNIVLISLNYDGVCELMSACGRQGTPAERVAKEAAKEVSEYLDADVPVGQHLADQLILPLGISAWQGHGGSFRTLSLTEHSRTHLEVVRKFCDVQVSVLDDPQGVTVSIVPPA